MAFIEVRGTKFFYREAGHGPPLLLIHGTGGHADNFEASMGLLADHYRVIAYDRRGYSRSVARPHPPADHFGHHAEDAAALLRALEAVPASVLGWSAGGLVAFELALRYPTLVKHVIVHEPPFQLTRDRSWPLLKTMAAYVGLRALGRKRAAATAFFRGALAHPDGSNAWDSLPAASRESVLVNADTMHVELSSARLGETLPPERLRQITCPITGIVGMRSSPPLVAASERLAKALPALHLVRVPDGDHLMMRARPDEFARVVCQALESEPPARPEMARDTGAAP